MYAQLCNLRLQAAARRSLQNFSISTLQLRTVFSTMDSYRTISVHPYISGDVYRKDFHVRDVKVSKSPPELILEPDFAKLRVGWQERLVLREFYMPVIDVITALGDGDLDPARITFRVTISSGGSLQRRTSASGSWAAMTKGVVKGVYQPYYAFTLADVRAGKIAFLAGDGVAKAKGGDGKEIIFQIQAADDAGVLSDSDRSTSDPDPESVSLSVVGLKEIDAGKEMSVNDDRRATSGDGTLTPSDATLDAWISAAARSPRVLVRIEGAKIGETLFLEDGHDIASITSSWSWDSGTGIGILSLQSDGTATVDDFQAVLNALVLRTVRSDSASIRTISVRPDIASFRPDIAAEVPQKDYYVRNVLVRKSHKAPYVGVQEVLLLKFGQDDRAILSPSEFLVEDFDTSASDVTIVMRELSSGATLQKKDDDGVYQDITPEDDRSLEFTLEDLQQGLIAIYLPSLLGEKLTFELEARDGDGLWSDIGTGNTHTRGVRLFAFDPVRALSPEELETDLETGHQRAVPFGGLEKMIEEARSSTDRIGVLSIVLGNAVPGDRLLMRNHVSGIAGDWSDEGHRYTLTVYFSSTTSAKIAEALAEIYYRASESAGEKERKLAVSWTEHWLWAGESFSRPLFTTSLANRPPVLRNWGIAVRYHDITPAPDRTETSLDLGYHPFREYMPEILDNEDKVLRLMVVLADQAGRELSADERVFLPQQLQDEAKAKGLVLRELRSSDQKAHALVIEVAEAGYYKGLLRGGSEQIVLEAAASSPRTATMRLNYQRNGVTGFIQVPGASVSEQTDHWVVTYRTSERRVCTDDKSSVFYVAMHIGKHQVSSVRQSLGEFEFSLRSGQRAVDIKISMSYVSREGASRDIHVENPEWTDFEVEKEKARKAWNYYLSKIAIDEFQDDNYDKTDPLDKWSIFYSALYRSLLHMNTASDVDGNYKAIGGGSKNVSEAPTYGYENRVGTEGPPPKVYFTNFSGWDVYRSQMALVGLMAPVLSQDMAINLLESAYINGTRGWKGWFDAHHVDEDEGGDREIPRWTTGYWETGTMTGDPGSPSVASLFAFGGHSVSLTSMLEVLDRSSRHFRSSSGDAHHILEGVASDAAIAQMALWISR